MQIKIAEYQPGSSILDTAQKELAHDRNADPVVAPSTQYVGELHETATCMHQASDHAANDTHVKQTHCK